MKEEISDVQIENRMMCFMFSKSSRMRRLMEQAGIYVKMAVKAIRHAPDVLQTFVTGESDEGDKIFPRVFPNGWISPSGEFLDVGHCMHEATCLEVTGHRTLDLAGIGGWIKFTYGLPYLRSSLSLLDKNSADDRERVTVQQAKWLNEWLTEIANPESDFPRF